MNDKPAPNTLILCNDLMFSSHLNGAAQRAGKIPRTCLGQTSAIKELETHPIEWVIVDLELPTLDAVSLRAATTAKIVGFGPHVHTEKLAAAQAAGFDAVLTRGQAHRDLESILAGN